MHTKAVSFVFLLLWLLHRCCFIFTVSFDLREHLIEPRKPLPHRFHFSVGGVRLFDQYGHVVGELEAGPGQDSQHHHMIGRLWVGVV